MGPVRYARAHCAAVIALVLAAFATDPAEDYRGYVDQARFFLKKAWYADARAQLELAVASEDGRLDPEAWFLLAKVCYELGDLARAHHAADRALVNSRDPDQARQTHELLQFFAERFAFVTVEAPHDGIASFLDVELRSTILDPDLKAWLAKVDAALADPVVLPYTVGLPAGRYAINGVEVEVASGEHLAIEPPIRARAGRTLQVVEVELGLGATTAIGREVAHLLPAPTTELSVGLPIGPVVLGAVADWQPQPYTTRVGALLVAPPGWGAGARLGVEVPGTQPLVVRPSLAARWRRLPAFELACAGEPWICAPDAEVRQLYVYAPSGVLAAAVELAVVYQDRRRRSGLGAGAKVSSELWVGRLAPDGEAVGEGAVAFVVPADARGWRGGAVRVLATVSYAF